MSLIKTQIKLKVYNKYELDWEDKILFYNFSE